MSFDYAHRADPGGTHGANACWLSPNKESAAGLTWVSNAGLYSYYEVKKKGVKFLHPGPIRALGFIKSAAAVDPPWSQITVVSDRIAVMPTLATQAT